MQKRSPYFRIYGIFGVLLLTAGVWIGSLAQAQEEPSPAAGVPPVTLGGFLWTDTFGWISLNCINDWNNNGIVALPAEERCTEAGGRYAASVRFSGFSGELQGYAWSPHLGLICFGSTCAGDAPSGRAKAATFSLMDTVLVETPTGSPETVSMIPVNGFARAESMGAGNGWIDLQGRGREEDGRISRERGGLALQQFPIPGSNPPRTRFVLTGSAWQQNGNGTGVGWVYFGVSPPRNAPTDGNAVTDQRTQSYPARGEDCAVERPEDEDADDGRNGDDANGVTGANCQDYDCVVGGLPVSYYDSVRRECLYRAVLPSARTNERLDSDRNCFDGVDNDLSACEWDGLRYKLKGADGRVTSVDCPLSILPGSSTTPGIDCGDPACRTAVNPETGAPCVSSEFSQRDEYNFCHNGKDDDGDNLSDCVDPDCQESIEHPAFITCDPDNLCFGHDRKSGPCPAAPAGCCPAGCDDSDGDLVCNGLGKDNCPDVKNSDQADINANGFGDSCDAWLQTKQGTIYAKRLSGVSPPAEATSGQPRPFAKFCILTSGAPVPAGFTTEVPCELPNLSTLTSPQLISEFRLRQYDDSLALLTDTLRARLNIRGLKDGRYGIVEEISTDTMDVGLIADPTSVAVYHHSGGDLTLTNTGAISFGNGRRALPGARVILVEGGDLIIRDELRYASAVGADLRNLASLAFVVIGGDIHIDPRVQNLVGSFVTTGAFSTGTNIGGTDDPLDISGLLVARQFRFERQFRSQDRGAEVVTYDGRAVLNPPPGLADFVKTLPSFRTVVPR